MLHKFEVVLQTQQSGLFFVCTAIVEHLDGRLELIAWGSQDQLASIATLEELECTS